MCFLAASCSMYDAFLCARLYVFVMAAVEELLDTVEQPTSG